MIVFVGLDDQAWWAHRLGNPEGLITFFLALSRAKQRATFAFCRERGQRQRFVNLSQLPTDGGVCRRSRYEWADRLSASA